MKLTKQKVIKAINNSKGIISNIAKQCDCSWTAIKKYLVKHPDIYKIYIDELNRVTDLVEYKMLELIENGNEGLIKFYLSKKAKDRGYGEDKHEIDITTNNEPINIIKLVKVIRKDDNAE